MFSSPRPVQAFDAHFWSVSIDWFGALLLLKLAWRFRSPGEIV